MDINVAGTAAIGDYLTSEIQNTRILFSESPITGRPLVTAAAADTFAAQLPAVISAGATLASTLSANSVPGPAVGTPDSGAATADATAASAAATTTAASIAGSVAASAAAATGTQSALTPAQQSPGIAPVAAAASSQAIGGQTPQQTEDAAFAAGLILPDASNASVLLGSLGLGLNVNTYA